MCCQLENSIIYEEDIPGLNTTLPRMTWWCFLWCWTFNCLFSTAFFSCRLQWGGCREKMQICCLLGLRFFLANEVVSLFSHYLFFKPPSFQSLFLTIAAVLCFTSSCQYLKPIYFVQTQATDNFIYSHEMESDEGWLECAWTVSSFCQWIKAFVHLSKKSAKVPSTKSFIGAMKE